MTDAQAPAPADDPQQDPLTEHTLASTQVLAGRFLQVFRDRVRLPGGQEAWREYVQHPGAVMIVPRLADGRLVLERQFRYPHHRSYIEFPAGKLDPREDPLRCAQRELAEETGYRAGRLTPLGVIDNAIAYSDERIVLVLAEDLTPGPQRLDDGEHLEVFTATLAQLFDWIRDGTVTDVKTIVGAFRLERLLSGAWPAAPAEGSVARRTP